MATIPVTIDYPLPEVIRYTWVGMTGADVGQAVKLANYPDKNVQFGALGGQTHGGATTVLQVSNDAAVDTTPDTAIWFTATDPNGNAITTTANKNEQVLENSLYMRPSQSAGSAGDLDVILVCKR